MQQSKESNTYMSDLVTHDLRHVAVALDRRVLRIHQQIRRLENDQTPVLKQTDNTKKENK
jgi:hypothetical protein